MHTPDRTFLDMLSKRRIDRSTFDAVGARLLIVPAFFAVGFFLTRSLIGALGTTFVGVLAVVGPALPTRFSIRGVFATASGLELGRSLLVPWSGISSIRLRGTTERVFFGRDSPQIVDVRVVNHSGDCDEYSFPGAIGPWSAERFVRGLARSSSAATATDES